MKATTPIGSVQIGVILTAVATAVIHLVLAVPDNNILFYLNGLGYLGLVAGLYFLPQLAGQRSLVRWVLIGFTAVTFVLYFVFNWPDVWNVMGILDKIIELALIILLWLDKNN
jgi:hypothetical protein